MENSPSTANYYDWKSDFLSRKYYKVPNKECFILRKEIVSLCDKGFTFNEAVKALAKAGKGKVRTTKQVINKKYAKIRGVY